MHCLNIFIGTPVVKTRCATLNLMVLASTTVIPRCVVMNRYAELADTILLDRIGRHYKTFIASSFDVGAVAGDQKISLLIVATGLTDNIYKFLIDLVHCLVLLING